MRSLVLLLVSLVTQGMSCPLQSPCISPDKDAICTVSGNNFETFDSITYSYKVCNHYLVYNLFNNNWNIVEKRVCPSVGVCEKHLVISQKSRVIEINADLNISYSGYVYTPHQAHAIGKRLDEFEFHQNGDKNIYFRSLIYGFWINFDTSGNVKIGVPDEFSHKVNGLCGLFNGNPNDDTTKSDGKQTHIAQQFGDSWQVPGTATCEEDVCTVAQRAAASETCMVMSSKKPLSQCAVVINFNFCLRSCEEEMCECLVNGGDEGCTCDVIENFMKQCQAQAPELDLQEWRSTNTCPATCPTGMEYHDCYKRQCEPSCSNMNEADEVCPEIDGTCYSGCYCEEGLVKKDDKCVRPDECKDCLCELNMPHIITFDNTAYDFYGTCTHIAVRDKVLPSQEHKFQVMLTSTPCDEFITCAESTTVVFDDHVVQVIRDEDNENMMAVYVDEVEISAFPHRSEWLVLEQVAAHHTTILIRELQLEVGYYYRDWKVALTLSSFLFSKELEGLCGNCNKNRFDDLVMSTGELTTNAEDFANSWIVSDVEKPEGLIELSSECADDSRHSAFNDDAMGFDFTDDICHVGYPVAPQDDPCFKLNDQATFGKCLNMVDVQPYIDQCQRDMCHSEQRDSVFCTSFASYAHACRDKGVCLDWRTPSFCPMTCTDGKVYKACGSGCEITCLNLAKYENDQTQCKINAVEGCFCPDGLVSKLGKCVKPETCKDCTCKIFGDPHYFTFDQTFFSFQGKCTYLASRDIVTDGSKHAYEVMYDVTGQTLMYDVTGQTLRTEREREINQVYVTNSPCNFNIPDATCLTGITILYDGHVIDIRERVESLGITTTVDSESVTSFPVNKGWLKMESAKNKYIIVYIPDIQLEVAYSSKYSFTLKLASVFFPGNVEGLCGNCNADPKDDFVSRDGSLVTNEIDFASSWAHFDLPAGVPVEPGCSGVRPRFQVSKTPSECIRPWPLLENRCNKIMDKSIFGECHHIVSPHEYLVACEFDLCYSKDRDGYICDFLSNYVKSCADQGIIIDWRTSDLCPYKCPPGAIYHARGSACAATCSNYLLQMNENYECGIEDREGCHCPFGMVFDAGLCIPVEQCKAVTGCQAISIDPLTTVGLVAEVHGHHGKCISKTPTAGFKKCYGLCDSNFYYNAQVSALISECKWCKEEAHEFVYVTLTCEDNFKYTRKFSTPSKCSCVQCS